MRSHRLPHRIRLASLLAAPVLLLAVAAAPAQEPEWSYEGETGPAHWSMLSPAFAACGEATAQSPLDLVAPDRRRAPRIVAGYRPGPVELEHTGETVDVVPEHEHTLRVGRDESTLAQLHFHAPSEHRIAGRRFPLEIHFVHQAQDGRRAVLGVLVERGRRNAAFARLARALPRSAGEVRTADRVDLAGLLPASRRAYRYDGSLTTPPCTEGIRWMVLRDRVTLAARQLRRLRQVVGGNARPIQPAGGRVPVLG